LKVVGVQAVFVRRFTDKKPVPTTRLQRVAVVDHAVDRSSRI
jgi:hypothetical protein